ncbi:4-hydroxy-3-methylbut-2-enyl diphosphate reductase [Candidatus Micrarchaeota archaeon]|nr:4-hydroxy-3-methylbut-2-enyl diphosphate reductase [Candidatus Micrarchaeota archaeon]MBU2476744.1 4-hydroxy-3-methylbut-2-enyl diphosphate reductase [Candidatus Micrarchaeota archaeon]
MTVEKVVLVCPRGFCAGVKRAIEVVEDCIKLFGKPVYVKHEIVHNKKVVEDLEKKGAITIEDIEEVPDNSVVVFSAHGSPPEHYEIAKRKNLKLIDATCPLVTKVHLEVKNFAEKGFKIIYVCHKNHIEAQGVMGELKQGIYPVENKEDVEKLDFDNTEKLVYLTQTTLSVDEAKQTIKAIKEKFPEILDPPKQDICYATTNRQGAIKELVKKVDLVLVVGSETSSNSKRLVETAKAQGKKAFLIDGVEDLKEKWFEDIKSVGVSAGASSPEKIVQEIADYFEKKGATKEELIILEEKMGFVEPFELTKMKKGKSI